MRGEPAAAARERVISESPPLISQRSGPLTASPKGEANAIAKKVNLQAFPHGGKVAPQGRMRGEFATAARERVISESPPLISQRSGPLTASPKGEAGAIAKK